MLGAGLPLVARHSSHSVLPSLSCTTPDTRAELLARNSLGWSGGWPGEATLTLLTGHLSDDQLGGGGAEAVSCLVGGGRHLGGGGGGQEQSTLLSA